VKNVDRAYAEAHRLAFSDTEREAFELAYRLEAIEKHGAFHGGDLVRGPDGKYISGTVEGMWWSWATRAAIAHGSLMVMAEAFRKSATSGQLLA
jgi:hypothetical protein